MRSDISYPEMLNSIEREAINSLAELVLSENSVEEIYVYGSRVTGVITEESDLDVAVVVRDERERKKIVKLLDSELDLYKFFEKGVDLHPLVITRAKMENMPIGENIRQGVLIWSQKIGRRT